MKQIDFLPNRYHEQGVKRKLRIWRIAMVSLFSGICLATAIGQQMLRSDVSDQVAAVEAEFATAQSTNERYNSAQARLGNIRAEAELFTFLRRPWPKTQILSSISKLIPASVSLVNLRIEEYRAEVDESPRARRQRAQTQNEPEGQLAAQKDLSLFREKYGKDQTIVYVKGHTTDTTTLHNFVAALSEHEMFSKAELVFVEALEDQERENTSEFNLRLIVRPSYGSPNGPGMTSNNRQRPLKGDA